MKLKTSKHHYSKFMENQKTKKVYMTRKRKNKKLKNRVIAWLIVGGILSGVIMSQSAKLNKSIAELTRIDERVENVEQELERTIEVVEVLSETIREVTAYNVGDPAQTDDSPCIGASNKNLCEKVAKGENICAANFVPFGTRLQITADNGWEFECVVEDRMNSRYSNRVDIAMSLDEKQRALQFGLQKLNVRVLGDSEILTR